MRIQEIKFNVPRTGKIMNIYILPDCHFGSQAFLEHEFDRLATIIEEDPLAKVIFQGDIFDSNRPTTRKIKKVAYHDRPEEYKQEDARNEYWIDGKIIPKIKRLIKHPGSCLGMLDGDHFMQMESGLSSTQYLCAKLKVPYLGDGQAILKMMFIYNSKVVGQKYLDGGRCTLQMHVQHGIGGTGRVGSGVNKLEDMANIWEGIDIFARGHSHKGFIFPISKYYTSNKTNEVRQRDIWLVNTPSFRTGYIIGETDYAEQRNYAATAHKFPVIHISCDKRRTNHDTFRVNITGELV